jgi:hypothetical protein
MFGSEKVKSNAGGWKEGILSLGFGKKVRQPQMSDILKGLPEHHKLIATAFVNILSTPWLPADIDQFTKVKTLVLSGNVEDLIRALPNLGTETNKRTRSGELTGIWAYDGNSLTILKALVGQRPSMPVDNPAYPEAQQKYGEWKQKNGAELIGLFQKIYGQHVIDEQMKIQAGWNQDADATLAEYLMEQESLAKKAALGSPEKAAPNVVAETKTSPELVAPVPVKVEPVVEQPKPLSTSTGSNEKNSAHDEEINRAMEAMAWSENDASKPKPAATIPPIKPEARPDIKLNNEAADAKGGLIGKAAKPEQFETLTDGEISTLLGGEPTDMTREVSDAMKNSTPGERAALVKEVKDNIRPLIESELSPNAKAALAVLKVVSAKPEAAKPGDKDMEEVLSEVECPADMLLDLTHATDKLPLTTKKMEAPELGDVRNFFLNHKINEMTGLLPDEKAKEETLKALYSRGDEKYVQEIFRALHERLHEFDPDRTYIWGRFVGVTMKKTGEMYWFDNYLKQTFEVEQALTDAVMTSRKQYLAAHSHDNLTKFVDGLLKPDAAGVESGAKSATDKAKEVQKKVVQPKTLYGSSYYIRVGGDLVKLKLPEGKTFLQLIETAQKTFKTGDFDPLIYDAKLDEDIKPNAEFIASWLPDIKPDQVIIASGVIMVERSEKTAKRGVMDISRVPVDVVVIIRDEADIRKMHEVKQIVITRFGGDIRNAMDQKDRNLTVDSMKVLLSKGMIPEGTVNSLAVAIKEQNKTALFEHLTSYMTPPAKPKEAATVENTVKILEKVVVSANKPLPWEKLVAYSKLSVDIFSAYKNKDGARFIAALKEYVNPQPAAEANRASNIITSLKGQSEVQLIETWDAFTKLVEEMKITI